MAEREVSCAGRGRVDPTLAPQARAELAPVLGLSHIQPITMSVISSWAGLDNDGVAQGSARAEVLPEAIPRGPRGHPRGSTNSHEPPSRERAWMRARAGRLPLSCG